MSATVPVRVPRRRLSARLDTLGRMLQNAAQLLARGSRDTRYGTPYEVVYEQGMLRLRQYAREPRGHPATPDPVLLVPPLMVTPEVYDISPELSAVGYLGERGLDVWIVDFGVPEEEEGGMERTLDDHVLAVDQAVDVVGERTGRPVHLVGYSQGGMFAYLAAAYRRSRSVASVVTFGSPVDMRRNLPLNIHETLVERFLSSVRDLLGGKLGAVEGLPGWLTSSAFKALSPAKELQQLVQLVGLLDDREALSRIMPKRRFLGGEGFIAWPGPAFRNFVDQFVVENRMQLGGFVIGGRTVTLADIDTPLLYVVGERDELARPASCRAIRRAAPQAELHEVRIDAGHFGLVVGSRAMRVTWPTFVEWLAWRSGRGEMPTVLRAGGEGGAIPDPDHDALQATRREPLRERMRELTEETVDRVWHGLGEAALGVSHFVEVGRWQLPRLVQLLGLSDDSRVSLGRVLADKAASMPDSTAFLWHGRAFSYRQANERVNRVARALVAHGVGRGEHVGVLMHNHPEHLTTVTALNRIGAVAVLLNPEMRGRSLAHAVETGLVERIVADAELAELAVRDGLGRPVEVLGASAAPHPIPDEATDLDPDVRRANAEPPTDRTPDPGIGSDLAMLLFTSGTTGLPKAARVTNRRQMAAALWAAAACELTPRDTVYCCLPLHHATGMMVAVGGAVLGGARLALAPRFSAQRFWSDVRRYGADVVFYVGEMSRYLVNAAPRSEDRSHPVRRFIGNGMRSEVWRQLQDRFGPVQVIEFYASTEGNVVLANLQGTKVGSVGRPFTGGGQIALVRYDLEREDIVRDAEGWPEECQIDETGLLLARIEPRHPLARFDGYVDEEATEERVRRDLFERGDAWFDTGDLLKRDEAGDFWFVDRLGDTFRWKGENVSTALVESVVDELPFVAMNAVYGVELPGFEGRAGMAAIQLVPGQPFDGDALAEAVQRHLTAASRPRFVRLVEELPTTSTHKPLKRRLQAEGADPARVADELLWYDEAHGTYRPLDRATWESLIASRSAVEDSAGTAR